MCSYPHQNVTRGPGQAACHSGGGMDREVDKRIVRQHRVKQADRRGEEGADPQPIGLWVQTERVKSWNEFPP